MVFWGFPSLVSCGRIVIVCRAVWVWVMELLESLCLERLASEKLETLFFNKVILEILNSSSSSYHAFFYIDLLCLCLLVFLCRLYMHFCLLLSGTCIHSCCVCGKWHCIRGKEGEQSRSLLGFGTPWERSSNPVESFMKGKLSM